jgi:3-isopropylmalate/(R)-2-methylmalate dehydratase small subunit
LTIVARGFARIFLQNAVNLGLRVVTCPTVEAAIGDEIEISEREILNRTTGKRFPVVPLPPARRAIMEAGGLIPYTKERLVKCTL